MDIIYTPEFNHFNILMMEERQTIFGLGVGSATKYVNPNDWTLTQHNNPKDLYFYNQRIDELIENKIMQINTRFHRNLD